MSDNCFFPLNYFIYSFYYYFFVQGISQAQLRQYPPNPTMVMRSIINMNNPNAMMSRNQLTTINQSQLSAQLGLNMTGPNITHTSPSPPASKSATPSPSSSINEDDQDDGSKVSDLWPLRYDEVIWFLWVSTGIFLLVFRRVSTCL